MSSAQIFWRLLRGCLASPARLVVAVTSLVTAAGAQLGLTWIVKLWAEGPLTTHSEATLSWLMAAASAVMAVLVVSLFLSRYLLNSINQRLLQQLRDAVQERCMRMEMRALGRHHSGDLMSRMFNDANQLTGFVRNVLQRLVGESLVIVGAIAMMFYLQWWLALAACLTVPVVVLLLSRLGRVIRQRGAAAQREVGTLSAILSEQLRGLTTIKAFQTEGVEHHRFARQNTRYRDQVLRTEWWTAMLVALVWLVTGALLLALIWYGSWAVIAGRLTSGGLVAFCLYAVQTVEPLRRLSDVQALLQRGIAAAARLYEIIDTAEIERPGGLSLPSPVRGALRFEAVSFGYRSGEPVISGLDLRIGAGERVAMVAASGGGKSTLAALLMRYAEPQGGCISLDGIALCALDLSHLRRAVCLVEQQPFIFSGPLIENIRYGSWKATRAMIDMAVAWAGLAPLVGSLPGGLEAWIAEGGNNLSGGQKQRLALARAIVRDPAVLVLDEATGALDSEAERQIFAGMESWLARRTVLVMAHRFSTVARFPRLVVLEGGHAVGDGSVLELIEHCSQFRQLFSEQIELPVLDHAAIEGEGTTR